MSNHMRAFVFSIELLQEMITTGWGAGTKSIVRCTHGLPENAKFEYIEPSNDDVVVLVFSHPTWPLAHVDDVPHEAITMQNIAIKEPR